MSYGTFGAGDYLTGTYGANKAIPLTFVAWVKRTAAQWADTSTDYIVHLGDDFANRFDAIALRAGGAADTIECVTFNPANSAAASHSFTDGTYDDKWVVIVATVSATNNRDVYIEDSTNTQNNTNDKDPSAALDSLIVGSRLDNAQQFAGLIAEVAIFANGWGATEVNQLQTAPETGPPPNTIDSANCLGYWSLSTNQATHTDESGNGGPSLAENGTVAFNADHPIITRTIGFHAANRGIMRGLARGIG